jgi:hypothetical protein
MTALLLACLGGILLLLPVRSQAEPVTPAAAGEAAECHELLKLCQAVRRQATITQKWQAKVGRKIDAQQRAEQKRTASWQRWRKDQERSHAGPDKAVHSVEKYQRATAKESKAVSNQRQVEERYTAESQLYQERLQAAQEAAAAMRAKYAPMPTCSQSCADVLDLEELQ